ncbi:MAG: hypothetical protein J5806_12635 [Lentisphaeria bacterium]|nr:hypothetical protein [Lentisphaeria bacterium]
MKYRNWQNLKIQLTALREFAGSINDEYRHDLALRAIENCEDVLAAEDFVVSDVPERSVQPGGLDKNEKEIF